ncbi:hypothetical protein BLKGLAD_72900 (plasmid) [Burkholderia gladioli pv. gladioli]
MWRGFCFPCLLGPDGRDLAKRRLAKPFVTDADP